MREARASVWTDGDVDVDVAIGWGGRSLGGAAVCGADLAVDSPLARWMRSKGDSLVVDDVMVSFAWFDLPPPKGLAKLNPEEAALEASERASSRAMGSLSCSLSGSLSSFFFFFVGGAALSLKPGMKSPSVDDSVSTSSSSEVASDVALFSSDVAERRTRPPDLPPVGHASPTLFAALPSRRCREDAAFPTWTFQWDRGAENPSACRTATWLDSSEHSAMPDADEIFMIDGGILGTKKLGDRSRNY
mmetsp:Transcript_20702/g.43501  ORF Transcript_20702/g.43501 Transcript_20702/m.43501 type:complete len:246 (-) Transcript_20702:223-960(-)